MKQRFSSLDIKVIAHELATKLISLRVSSIYDLSTRIFLFKFAKPDHREQLVIDSGFRCHLTDFGRTTAAAPSPFVARLRKYLKTRRVTSVAQVGTDRILEIQFSDGQYRLFFEFYAGGNIVLTDKDLAVLALLRVVNEGAEHEHVRPGGQYNLSERQNVNGVPALTVDRIKDGLQKFINRQTAGEQTQSKKSKKKTADTLRKALAGSINEYPPLLLEHALAVTGFDASKTPEEVLASDELVQQVFVALEEAGRTMDEIMKSDVTKGYIVAKPANPASGSKIDGTQAPAADGAQKPQGGLMYSDFHPFKPRQFQDDNTIEILEFDGFNRTVDEFFSSIEGQKLESRLQEKEENARKKLEHAKQDQEKRIGGLQEVQSQNVRKAQAIEANLMRVEEATKAINDLIARGMDWSEIDKIIELEQARGNPVAQIIATPLKLDENSATLNLAEQDYEEDAEDAELTDDEPDFSDDEDDGTTKKQVKSEKPDASKTLAVDIDLALSAWSNAREYYDQKKTAAVKQEKTVLASTKALKSAQIKIEADLKKALKQEKQVLRPVRRQFWFEKFIYFISSDGYLVVGGKDAQQSDLIYRKYLKKGDVFVGADLAGAASMLIKNNSATPDAPIPPSTLSQAGTMSVATSTAWDSKAVMSAWWAPAEQVTKMAPTGDFLKPGDFHVKGTKNFLPPAQLLLGFAVIWQISEASKARHVKHRMPAPASKGASDATDTVEASMLAERSAQAEDVSAQDGDDEHLDDGASETASEHADNDGDDDAPSAYANPLQSTAAQQTDDEADGDNDSSDDETQAAADPEPATAAGSSAAQTSSAEPVEDTAESSSSDEETTTSTTPFASGAAPETTKPRPAPAVRGKRGKKKKMAAKYQDQDAEDRELAMRLLGSKAGQDKAAEEQAAKTARDAAAAEAKERRRLQHLKTQKEGREAEALRAQQQHAEGAAAADEDDEDDALATTDLDALVPAPLPGDELLEAIPVCAPWSALARHKYKVKLQPGSQKKGKAVREILARWGAAGGNRRWVDEKGEDVERIWPREVELVKGWRDTEVFNVLPVSKVRVVMGGGAGGGSGGGSGGGGGKGGAKGRGGRGSKKR